jgi:hypothetical protein
MHSLQRLSNDSQLSQLILTNARAAASLQRRHCRNLENQPQATRIQHLSPQLPEISWRDPTRDGTKSTSSSSKIWPLALPVCAPSSLHDVNPSIQEGANSQPLETLNADQSQPPRDLWPAAWLTTPSQICMPAASFQAPG